MWSNSSHAHSHNLCLLLPGLGMLTGSFLHKMGGKHYSSLLLLKVLGTFAVRQSKWRGSRKEKYIPGLYFLMEENLFALFFFIIKSNKTYIERLKSTVFVFPAGYIK